MKESHHVAERWTTGYNELMDEDNDDFNDNYFSLILINHLFKLSTQWTWRSQALITLPRRAAICYPIAEIINTITSKSNSYVRHFINI